MTIADKTHDSAVVMGSAVSGSIDKPINHTAECDSWHRMKRRQWLGGSIVSATSLQLGGLGLSQIANQLAQASDSPREDRNGRTSKTARSLIVLWMQGGPSQLETFDPHAGTMIGGDVKAISTSIPKIEIADTMPQTAELLNMTTLVRSMVSKEGDHERATYHVKSGWRRDPTLVHPSIGAVLCHETSDSIEIPRHVTILSGQWPARGGYLGADLDAFQMNDPQGPLPNLRSPAPNIEMQKRLHRLSSVVDREFTRGRFENMDRDKTQHITATERANAMMGSDQIKAFDIKEESQETRTRFGETPFGRGCLAAIRLIEQGVRCVEIELNGWDSHINNHELQSARCKTLDTALAALLKELKARDLFNSTLVVCGGEFGRTPEINVSGGRDHWPVGFSTLIAGGPMRRGYVHGATSASPSKDSEKNWDEVADKVTVPDLHATLLTALGIDIHREITTPIGRPMVMSEGEPIKDLLDV